MNLWHDIKQSDNIAEEIKVIIEITKGSNNKYELDKETGLISLDRANYTSSAFPFDYGFIPQTLWADGDPLDVVVLSTFPIEIGILVKVRPVALIEMIDGDKSDFKIIGVPINDKRLEEITDLNVLNKHSLKEYQHFFETYKNLDGKEGDVSIKEIKGKEESIEVIKKSINLYKEKLQG